MQHPSFFLSVLLLSFLSIAILITSGKISVPPSSPSSTELKNRVLKTLLRVPPSFEANQGQTDSQVKFLSRANGYTLFVTAQETVIALRSPSSRDIGQESRLSPLAFGQRTATHPWQKGLTHSEEPTEASDPSVQAPVVRMKLAGANPDPRMVGLEELPGKNHYFTGNDPIAWRTNIPAYAKVRLEAVYPGIDMVYYGNQSEMEYDFMVSPGANPSQVVLDFSGIDRLNIDSSGNLVLCAAGEDVRMRKPLIYQEASNERIEIEGGYALLAGNRVGFDIGHYDASRLLVIDPVLDFSTYLGGNDVDQINAIALDSSGNIYVTGTTSATNFPLVAPIQAIKGASSEAFVSKLNPSGSALLYSTYIGGAAEDHGHDIAVDSLGNAYVFGDTASANFPLVNPLRISNTGSFDLVIFKLNPEGSAMSFSTYWGGSASEGADGIALDSSGNLFLTGITRSSNFPTVAPFQAALSGTADAFIMKMNSTGSSMLFSTFLGGSGFEIGYGIAIDPSGNPVITGSTDSVAFPTLNPLQSTFGGGTCSSGGSSFPCDDVFVSKLSSSGTALIYSSFLGGNSNDAGLSIASDASGNIYIAGLTQSFNFPTFNPYQSIFGGGTDAFVAKLNPAGSSFIYSTYLGGGINDVPNSIAVDALGNAYITGGTDSTSFPLVNSMQSLLGTLDSFITKFNASGSTLAYSTLLGGSGSDVTIDIAVDSSGAAFVAGITDSTNFPTAKPLQTSIASIVDAFISKVVFRQALNPGGIVNAASYSSPVAPGSIATAFGTDLTSLITQATQLPLPTTLDSITLRLNNIAAPLIVTTGQQINFQLPWELEGQSQATVVASIGSLALPSITVNLANTAPGIFTMNQSGSGQGAILISNSAIIAAPATSIPGWTSRPANRGEYITIYCTGLGPVTNRPLTAAPALRNPLSATTSPVTVTIGGVSVIAAFAGLSPDFVGLYQVDVPVPQNAPTGSAVTVTVQVGGSTSNSVIMAVQ